MFPFATEGRDVYEIAAVLEELEDWEALADQLGIARATMTNIRMTCATFGRAQCHQRLLVKTYCDMHADGDPHKTATDIANILSDRMGKKRQAKLKELKIASELDCDYYSLQIRYCFFPKGSPDQNSPNTLESCSLLLLALFIYITKSMSVSVCV